MISIKLNIDFHSESHILHICQYGVRHCTAYGMKIFMLYFHADRWRLAVTIE